MKYSPAQVRQPVQALTYKPSISAFPVYAPAKAPLPMPVTTPRPLPSISLPNPSITPTPVSPQASAIQAQIDMLRPNAAGPEDVARINDLVRQRDAAQHHYEHHARSIPPVMGALSEAIDRLNALLQTARDKHAGLMRATEYFRRTMPRSPMTTHLLATDGTLQHLHARVVQVRAFAHEATPLSAPRALQECEHLLHGLHRLLEEMAHLYHQTGHEGPIPDAVSLSGAEIAPPAPEHPWRSYVKPAVAGIVIAWLVYSYGSKAR